MMNCEVNARTSRYLPKVVISATSNFETDSYQYDYINNSVNCKLLTINPYKSYFQQVYPLEINEYELTNDMLNVLQTYTDSQTNECYMKTNLNLLSSNLNDIDWIYVNKLRSLIRSLIPKNLKHTYYRGLTLSDQEIQYYIEKKNQYYYTNSFTSFTIDRLLIYSGNTIMMLKTENCSDKSKINLANIWKWSKFTHEKEALLAVGTKLKVLSVHFYGCKWEIEVELAEDDDDDD